jgi:hypothetical protein
VVVFDNDVLVGDDFNDFGMGGRAVSERKKLKVEESLWLTLLFVSLLVLLHLVRITVPSLPIAGAGNNDKLRGADLDRSSWSELMS